jgi:hypothetical protein
MLNLSLHFCQPRPALAPARIFPRASGLRFLARETRLGNDERLAAAFKRVVPEVFGGTLNGVAPRWNRRKEKRGELIYRRFGK